MDLPLPPCVHNKMIENIDAILKDLQEVFVNKVEHNQFWLENDKYEIKKSGYLQFVFNDLSSSYKVED